MLYTYVIAGSMIVLVNSLLAKVAFFRSTESLLQVELKTLPTCVPAGFPPPGEQPRQGSGNPSKNNPPQAGLGSRSKDTLPPSSYRSSKDTPRPSGLGFRSRGKPPPPTPSSEGLGFRNTPSGGAWPGLDSNPRQGLKQECLVADGGNEVKLTKTLITMEKLCFRAEIRMKCNGEDKWIGLGQMMRESRFKAAVDAMSYDKFINCQKVFNSFGISARSKSDGINQMCQRAPQYR